MQRDIYRRRRGSKSYGPEVEGALLPMRVCIADVRRFRLNGDGERERYIVYKEEKEIYILQEIDVCCLVPFLLSFPFHEPSYFSFRPLSNVSISVRGPVLVFVLIFSPDAGAIDDIIRITKEGLGDDISN